MDPQSLLSFIVFFPAVAALALAVFPRDKVDLMRFFALGVTAIIFLLTAWMAWQSGQEGQFVIGQSELQNAFSRPWIPSFNIFYFMGLDGISFPLLLLTSFTSLVAMGASWSITKHVKAYLMLFLVLETGMLGVFLALDFFLFYIFWEVMLLPMYFLIGIWGGPRREYAAIKFFLYTLLGSILMLIAILMLYFNSDLRSLPVDDLIATKVVETPEAAEALRGMPGPQHSFNIMALAKVGQLPDSPFNNELLWGRNLSWWAFLLLFIGFAIKVPVVPVHTWLPDAHVEAPTPISMILAGVLLKMGGYGILRICYPICPDGGYDLAGFVTTIGVVSMVYGAFAALAQKDFKRMVAYSSVSHMGYVVLGLGVWSAAGWNNYDPRYWAMGMNGAMFQMIAHGISSAGMFFMVGVLYDRVHHRNLEEFGGLFGRMPVYSGLAFVIFFAGLGLPGLCGFIGEVLVTLSVWNYSGALAVVAASVVILTAAYILWALQRVYLGAEYKGPHGDHLTPITPRELAISIPLVVLAIYFGVFPQNLLVYMEPTITQTATELSVWTRKMGKEPAGTGNIPVAAPTKPTLNSEAGKDALSVKVEPIAANIGPARGNEVAAAMQAGLAHTE
ncbi:MAG: NADH-quinone oxidoreductase subunit M [Pirellulales bacterium]|nr:NADH-quinone oxidoreductase subunit M [Pirellulales bacterium]